MMEEMFESPCGQLKRRETVMKMVEVWLLQQVWKL